jgi:hypothetical protein
MKIGFSLLALLAFWLCSSAAFCEPVGSDSTEHPVHKVVPAPEWALDRFKLCWDAMKKDSLSERIYNICWRDLLSTGNIAPFSSTLQSWALDGVRPKNPPLLRFESYEILSLFRNDTTRQALRSLIRHGDTLDVLAAKTLIHWGDWDIAAPVLEKYGLYEDLAVDQRAIPVLYRALRQKDLTRRLRAANVLYSKLDKPDSLHLVARKVLSLPSSMRGPTITKLAVDLLAGNPSPADLASLEHIVVTDTSRWSRLGAFGAIVSTAFSGDSNALAQLDTISRLCPDAEIRDRATGYVKETIKRNRGAAVLDTTHDSKQKQP